MEMVSAAKMRKAQATALSGRPYTTSLHEIMANVQGKTGTQTHPLTTGNESQSQLVIIIAPDRGLTGGLILNIFREILRSGNFHSRSGAEILPGRHSGSGNKTYFITVGRKAKDFAAKTSGDLVASYGSEEMAAINLARIIAKSAQQIFLAKEVGKVSLIYPHFESTIKQAPKWLQILPIENLEDTYEEIKIENGFIFEPAPTRILDTILKHHILTEIYQALVESKASEHSARMVAMKNATEAAEDLVLDLTLTYNQARQEAITTELLDIVTAQKAFE